MVYKSNQTKSCISPDKIEISFKQSALHMLAFNWKDQNGCLDEGNAIIIFKSQMEDKPYLLEVKVVSD
jgi:hypothetical protein